MTLTASGRPLSFGRPWLVIPGRAGAMAAAQDRAGRVISQRRAGHVRLVWLLPGIADTVRPRELVNGVMQPGVPFRRHLGALGLAVIDDPALFTARPPAALSHRLGAPLAVIAVTIWIGADVLA